MWGFRHTTNSNHKKYNKENFFRSAEKIGSYEKVVEVSLSKSRACWVRFFRSWTCKFIRHTQPSFLLCSFSWIALCFSEGNYYFVIKFGLAK